MHVRSLQVCRVPCKTSMYSKYPGLQAVRTARSDFQLKGIRKYSPIRVLQEKFRDPTSPYHIPPGTQGPESPNPPAEHLTANIVGEPHDPLVAGAARRELTEQGYDPASFWEQPIAWGDQDSFRHVNNVHYARFIESGRLRWAASLAYELGGPDTVQEVLAGKGISLIVKSIYINYKRPVTFPDTLLIAHKPRPALSARTPIQNSNGVSSISDDFEMLLAGAPRTHFVAEAVAYSYAQKRIVTESETVLVWYDYDRLAKCDPGEEMRRVLEGRMRLALAKSK